MKYIYTLGLIFFSFNLVAQTKLTKYYVKQTNNSSNANTVLSQKAKTFQTKNIQNRIDELELESIKVGKTKMPILYLHNSNRLILNGTGLREMFWVDLYACGLYLAKKNHNSNSIINDNSKMVIRLDILSNAISKEKLTKAFKKSFYKSNTKSMAHSLQKELDTFISFLDVEINVGDIYDIIYTPGVGTSLYINNKKKGIIKRGIFKKAIFNIWLSENPADKSLKKDLLGINSTY